MTDWRFEGLTAEVPGFRVGPVDLTVPHEGAVAVLGPSGAGKTTLLRAIAGLLSGTGGRLWKGSEERQALPPERRGIVYVPQGLALFPHRSVAANVAYPTELASARRTTAQSRAILARLGLAALAARRPSTLSSGEQQRVALARALSAGPELLLWDEPLTALDRTARDALLEVFRQVRDAEGLPLVFVTHDPTLAFSVADRAVVLSAGMVEQVGPIEQLLRHPTSPFVARFCGFENVVPAPVLASASDGWLGALGRAAGAGGVCFRALPADRASGEWSATVRRAEPTRGGFEYAGTVEGFEVRLRTEGLIAARFGDILRFDLPQHELIPIGPIPREDR